MKSYTVTTGAAFGLLALAHFARVVEEGAHLLENQSFWLRQLDQSASAFGQ